MKHLSTRDLILIALFAGLTSIGAFIKIPLGPVPFTLQSFFCAYAGILLGARKGLYSQLIYISIGLIGIPVFTKGGGLKYIFEPTFGFLIGFVFCAFIIGWLTENKPEQKLVVRFLAIMIGIAFSYGLGIPYFYFMWNYVNDVHISWTTVITWTFIPFIIPDVIKGLIVASTSKKIIPRINQQA